MISPNVTGNPAAIKDVMSGTNEQVGSVSFLSSLLSLISSLNPINTLRMEDRVETSSSGISQSPPDLIEQSISNSSFVVPATNPGIHTCTFLNCPISSDIGTSFTFNSYPSVKEPFGKSSVSADIQNPISIIGKEIAEFSSLNTVQSYHSIERETEKQSSRAAAKIEKNFLIKNGCSTALLLYSSNKFTSSPIETAALMETDESESKQEGKGSKIDDNSTLPLAGNRNSSLIFEDGNRDESVEFRVNEGADLYNFLKTLKESFEDGFKITKTEITTKHINENSVHPRQDVPYSSFVPRQIDLSSPIDNTPPQVKQSLEPSKVIISHWDLEQSLVPDISTMKVTVQHDGLGELDIELILNNGVINGQIKTPEVTTADLIVRNIPEIMNSLIRDGLNIGNFFVSLRNGRGGKETLDNGNLGDSGDNFGRQTSGFCPIPSNSGYINIFV